MTEIAPELSSGELPAEPRSRLRWYLLAEAAAIALGYLVSTLRTGAPRSARDWLLVVGGAIAVAVPLALKSRRELRRAAEAESAEALAIDAETRLRLVVGDVVTPIADLLGKLHLAHGDTRVLLRGQLEQLVVGAAANLCGRDRTRAIFFELEPDRLVPRSWTGRADQPTIVFTNARDDLRGREAIQLVRNHDYVFVADTDAERLPPGVAPRPDALYRCFISVSVFAGQREFGMLTVDAPEAGALDEGDVNVMRALAQLLGVGFVGRG